MKIIGMDLECANTYTPSAICWAGLVYADEKLNIIESKEFLINPNCKHFHTGEVSFPFTEKDLKDKPQFCEISDEFFKDFGEETLIIGHAVTGDFMMLTSACLKSGIKPFKCRFIDSQTLFALYKGDGKNLSLSKCAEEFGIEFDCHNPIHDAETSVRVVRKIMDSLGISLGQLLEKFSFQVGEVGNYYIKHPLHLGMNEKAVKKINNLNQIFDFFNSVEVNKINIKGKRIWLKNSIFASYDILEPIKFLNKKGYFICTDKSRAQILLGRMQSSTEKKQCVPFKIFMKSQGYKNKL